MTDPVDRARRAVDALPAGEGAASRRSGSGRPHANLRQHAMRDDDPPCSAGCGQPQKHSHGARVAGWCERHRPSDRLHDGGKSMFSECSAVGCEVKVHWWLNIAQADPTGYCDAHVPEAEQRFDEELQRRNPGTDAA